MRQTVRTEFPHRVTVHPHEWIPMSDGSRLAARLWMPEGAEEAPVPAVFEYVPYRKNDELALRDGPMHSYFAGHGYAAVRVDTRGAGDSDGILEDEYLPLEQADGVEIIEWLAAQPWCSGKVGIIGKSWGGFNSLQIATHRPEALRAVLSVASTDDRYADDVHYMGGCVLAWTALPWASTMLAYNARPPDPEVVGEQWRQMWFERMEKSPPFIEAWMSHQRRDDFWKQGSVCEDYSAITCPVYMVGGWSDAYRNAILRFLEHYPGPCKGLIGPWAHLYPHDGVPGPAIGFLQEAVRWWDCWLKDEDNGIMDEPKLRCWLGEARRPAPTYAHWPGAWVDLEGWPSRFVSSQVLELRTDGTLRRAEETSGAGGDATELRIRGAESVALDAGNWGGYGGPADCPPDQRADDGLSLCFETPPLSSPARILGFPIARLELAADRPLALVVARLCDVWPDGASTLMSQGLLNLTHRRSHEDPEMLEPGRAYVVDVQLNAIAYALPAGHRLRLAVSPTYWPWAWPSPEPVTLGVFTRGSSVLFLPVLEASVGGEPPPHFALAERGPSPPHSPTGMSEEHQRRMCRDVASGRVLIEQTSRSPEPLVLLESGIEYREGERDVFRIVEGEPLSASVTCEREMEISRGSWRTTVRTSSSMSSTADSFQLVNAVEGYEDGRRVFVKTWHRNVPRDHV
ncbi:MAG TPA: CocE/NonD family hydrolase [Acidimicrobiales bacterium]|nr:CocE/NonD family hydrolase [Acidimicrobiales bacterium]